MSKAVTPSHSVLYWKAVQVDKYGFYVEERKLVNGG